MNKPFLEMIHRRFREWRLKRVKKKVRKYVQLMDRLNNYT